MNPLDELAAMSNRLGDPTLDAAILGEGNTSIRCDDHTFWVKSSGCSLANMAAQDFVRLRFDIVLALMDETNADEMRISAVYHAAKVDQGNHRRPSIETLFHALLLGYPGVEVVAHTHPTAVNCLTCNPGWDLALAGRMFPDEAVMLGIESVFVPYTDPGIPLALAIRDSVDKFIVHHGETPKVIYLQNHGMIALAGKPSEAINITYMAIKAARIRLGAIQAGGIRQLPAVVIRHLVSRPDERYRRTTISDGTPKATLPAAQATSI